MFIFAKNTGFNKIALLVMESKIIAEKSLFIKSGPTIKRVLSSDILYVQCDGNVSHLYMLDGSELVCVRLLKRLRGTEWHFVAAGLFGGLAANYMQSTLEWVLRQQLNLVCLMFVFAIVSHLWTCSKKAKKQNLKIGVGAK